MVFKPVAPCSPLPHEYISPLVIITAVWLPPQEQKENKSKQWNTKSKKTTNNKKREGHIANKKRTSSTAVTFRMVVYSIRVG